MIGVGYPSLQWLEEKVNKYIGPQPIGKPLNHRSMPSNNLGTLVLHNISHKDIQTITSGVKKQTFDLDVPRLNSKQRKRWCETRKPNDLPLDNSPLDLSMWERWNPLHKDGG